MTDVLFVAAAYAIVLGGLAAYVAWVRRRALETRRIARALDSQRALDHRGSPPELATPSSASPLKTRR